MPASRSRRTRLHEPETGDEFLRTVGDDATLGLEKR
jgi:hypothetical protein